MANEHPIELEEKNGETEVESHADDTSTSEGSDTECMISDTPRIERRTLCLQNSVLGKATSTGNQSKVVKTSSICKSKMMTSKTPKVQTSLSKVKTKLKPAADVNRTPTVSTAGYRLASGSCSILKHSQVKG